MKPLIGIGLISYNRPQGATLVANSIIENLSTELYDYKLICALDQEDKTGYEVVEEKFKLLSHPNYGISINKSLALNELKECDHIFLIEDDLEITKKGWDTLFLNVHKESGIGLFNYYPKNSPQSTTNQTRFFPSGTVIYKDTHGALIMSITKDTLLAVGAFDPRYKGYGQEHYDYARRCKMAGKYHGAQFPFIYQTYEYTEMLPIPPSVTKEKRDEGIGHNCRLYTQGSPRVFIPYEEVFEVIKNGAYK